MKKHRPFKFAALAVLMASLMGCTASDILTGKTKRIIEKEGTKEVSKARELAPKKHALSNIHRVNEFYVPQLTPTEQNRPSWFFVEEFFRFNDYTLGEFMLDLQSKFDVNTRYVDNIDPKLMRFSLVHDGRIGDAMEKIKLATGLSYTLEGSVVTWSKYEIAHLDISGIPGLANFLIGRDENADTNSSSDSGGSFSTVVTESSIDNSSFTNFSATQKDNFQQIIETLNELKTDDGYVNVDMATSTLFVRDLPRNVADITRYVKDVNKRLTAQVYLDIKIVDFDNDKGDEFGIDWNAVVSELEAGGIATVTTGFSGNLLSGLTPTVLTYTRNEGKYSGSEAMIRALRQRGVVLNVTEPSVLVTNNEVAQIVKGEDVTYLASSGSNQTANSNSNILIPGKIQTGLQLYAVANINLDDMSIVGKISNKFSDIVRIDSVTSGGSLIQTPQESKNEFFQTFYAKDGETILLGGISERRSEYETRSTGMMLLGGQKLGRNQYTDTLIMITPQIIRQ